MKKLSSEQIRQMWLDFFKSKGHKVEKGASLIPHNDPTLLWINSGVAALKKYFDGSEIPPSKRITNAQKSIRTNDIDNVGHTARHHTFFEMLGNFSIGDYFRKEVIPWAFEILTSEKYYAMPKDKLYFTYFPSDKEAHDCWRMCGVEEDHLIPLEHNFWQIGEGPCGPNTEVFFDRGTKYDKENIGVRLLSEEIENDRYIEIWGIVFSQFNAQEGVDRKDYKELPSKNIDTGAGLERICCILQETETNFETDLFMPIIKETEKIAKFPYEGNYRSSYRVISDHIRACTFALSDGECFSNEGRGYVLRRLLRRAMRYAQKIGITKPFLSSLVPTVIKVMKCYYPELENNKDKIIRMIDAEERKFIKTLENGEQLLRKMISKGEKITGKDCFKLYDTYGFPFELTKEILEESNISVNEDEFKVEMEKQKETARNARVELDSMSSQSKDLMEFKDKSVFNYGFKPIKSKVIGLFNKGEKVDSLSEEGEIIFEETNFYAESGGQVSDTGSISNESTLCEVSKVIKAPNKQHLHFVKVNYGEIKVGDEFTLSINETRRLAIMRNHSCTHLLQAALDEVLSSEIAQTGSSVSEDYVHFDFNFERKITDEELSTIERKVNEWIYEAISGKTEVLPIEEARKIGAKALFDEKYGDVVRVVCFGEVSKEFCGGTHVSNTQDIGVFAIEFEESVASGVRRIQFRTSKEAYLLMKKRENLLSNVCKNVGAASYAEVLGRVSSLINAKDEALKANQTLMQKMASSLKDSLKSEFKDVQGYKVLVKYLEGTSRNALSQTIDSLKTSYPDSIVLLVGSENGSYPVMCAVTGKALTSNKAGIILGSFAKRLGGSGGGRPDFAQGGVKDISSISEAFKAIIEEIK